MQEGNVDLIYILLIILLEGCVIGQELIYIFELIRTKGSINYFFFTSIEHCEIVRNLKSVLHVVKYKTMSVKNVVRRHLP